VKLFAKNSNLCDHNPPTLQTDRQTDGEATCDRKTALCTKVHHTAKMHFSTSVNDINKRSLLMALIFHNYNTYFLAKLFNPKCQI